MQLKFFETACAEGRSHPRLPHKTKAAGSPDGLSLPVVSGRLEAPHFLIQRLGPTLCALTAKGLRMRHRGSKGEEDARAEHHACNLRHQCLGRHCFAPSRLVT